MTVLFDNTYAQLPERFFAKQEPARVPEPKLIRLNLELAAKLAIDADWLKSVDGVAMLAGMQFPRVPSRLHKPTLAISLEDSPHNSATVARSFSVKLSTSTAHGTIYS